MKNSKKEKPRGLLKFRATKIGNSAGILLGREYLDQEVYVITEEDLQFIQRLNGGTSL